VAERLDIDPSRVRVECLPPPRAPVDEGTFASRGVYVSGNALAAAADALGAALVERAAQSHGIEPSACRRVGLAVDVGGSLVPAQALGPLRAEGRCQAPDAGLVSGAQMVEVAVDTRTGRVRVERVVSVHDVGRLIDRELATGQVVGGVVQGIGMALSERLRHDAQGQPIEVDLLDQGLPGIDTAPDIEAVFVGDGPSGLLAAKGLGEAPVVGIVAAIANAVRDATGVSFDTVPLTPERVLEGLETDGAAPAPVVPVATVARPGPVGLSSRPPSSLTPEEMPV
jgi:CO/xanthine dehydrogenase Mo-binding subunit